MIFLKDQNIRATVWSVEDKSTYVKLSITTSEKKQDGTWENSKWYANAVGKAKDKARNLHEKDRIEITSAKITNVSKQVDGKWNSYLNFAIFDFNPIGESNAPSMVEISGDDDLPF